MMKLKTVYSKFLNQLDLPKLKSGLCCVKTREVNDISNERNFRKVITELHTVQFAIKTTSAAGVGYLALTNHRCISIPERMLHVFHNLSYFELEVQGCFCQKLL